MAIIVLCVWILFIVAFVLTKLFFPNIGTAKRRVKDIKAAPEYDEDGYDQNGFTSLGFHRNGTRYDDDGYDRYGVDRYGNRREQPKEEAVEYTESGEPVMSREKRIRIIAVAMCVITVSLVAFAGYDYVTNHTCVFGHTYVRTFCEMPEKCTRCGKQKGKPAGHLWMAADCEHPQICSYCRAEQGEPLGHDTDSGVCGRCGKKVG